MAPYCFIIVAHLQVLLEDLVHFLHGGAAACGDALAAFAVDDVVIAALLSWSWS